MALFSKSVQNAVSILTQIARNESGRPSTVNEVAEATGISGPTVAKTVQPLVKKRFLQSRKGPGGGLILGLPPELVSLGSIVVAIEGREPFEGCMAGLADCSEENVCPLHDKWKGVKDAILEFLKTTTLQDMVLAIYGMEGMKRASPKAGSGKSLLPILPPNGPPGGEDR